MGACLDGRDPPLSKNEPAFPALAELLLRGTQNEPLCKHMCGRPSGSEIWKKESKAKWRDKKMREEGFRPRKSSEEVTLSPRLDRVKE